MTDKAAAFEIRLKRGKQVKRLTHCGALPNGLEVGTSVNLEGQSWTVMHVKATKIFAAFRIEGKRLVQTQ